jgi:hypothetical protein
MTDLERLKAERDAAVAFRNTVIDECVVCHIYTAAHETDPKKALLDAIMWNQKVALDPAVSEDARALIAEGKRRATAAIVADLQAKRTIHHSAMAARYERGDHLTEAKPPLPRYATAAALRALAAQEQEKNND